MSIYTDAILTAATVMRMDSVKAAALKYPEVAVLAGLTLGKNGESPEDFVYIVERHQLSQALAAVEVEALAKTLRIKAQKAIEATVNAAGPVAEAVKLAALKEAGLTEATKSVAEKP